MNGRQLRVSTFINTPYVLEDALLQVINWGWSLHTHSLYSLQHFTLSSYWPRENEKNVDVNMMIVICEPIFLAIYSSLTICPIYTQSPPPNSPEWWRWPRGRRTTYPHLIGASKLHLQDGGSGGRSMGLSNLDQLLERHDRTGKKHAVPRISLDNSYHSIYISQNLSINIILWKVHENQADFSINEIAVTRERMQACDQSDFLYVEGQLLISQAPGYRIPFDAVIKPFTWMVNSNLLRLSKFWMKPNYELQ